VKCESMIVLNEGHIMGYQLNRHSASLWSIVDEEGRALFEGALSACEAWLDQQEVASQTSWFQSISSFFKKRASQPNAIPKETSPADSHPSFRITG
jgi:hypothetical protein